MTPAPLRHDSAIPSRPGGGSDRPDPCSATGNAGPTPIRLVGTNVVTLAVIGPLDSQHLIPLRQRISQLGAAGYRTINVDVDPFDNSTVIDVLRSVRDDAARSAITITINGGNGANA